MKIIAALLTICSIFSNRILLAQDTLNEIYVGKQGAWRIYYDARKENKIIEIGGIKYGAYDTLKHVQQENVIAKSELGELYKKGCCIYYKNSELKVDIRLDKRLYSNNIDYKRLQIFEINAFNQVSKLKESLKVSGYKFDWDVKDDYIYYRDTTPLSIDYRPNYMKKVYEAASE